MTIKQAEFEYGTLIYNVNPNDTLLGLARKLYDSDDDKYIRILMSLNLRVDWNNLKVGSQIKYIHSSNVKDILEVW